MGALALQFFFVRQSAKKKVGGPLPLAAHKKKPAALSFYSF
jgi:hypothetical protein